MGSVTYADICHQLAAALTAAKVGRQVQAYDKISESIPDNKTLHIYFNDGTVTAESGTDRKSFQAGARVTSIGAVMDGYARKRSNLSDDLKAQMELIDEIDAYLVSQTKGVLLGIADLKSFNWRWERTLFTYNKEDWAGCRFELELWIY